MEITPILPRNKVLVWVRTPAFDILTRPPKRETE